MRLKEIEMASKSSDGRASATALGARHSVHYIVGAGRQHGIHHVIGKPEHLAQVELQTLPQEAGDRRHKLRGQG